MINNSDNSRIEIIERKTLIRKIRLIIEDDGYDRFAIYPYGEKGKLVEKVLIKDFDNKPILIADAFGRDGNVVSLDDLKNSEENFAILLSSDREDIHGELLNNLFGVYCPVYDLAKQLPIKSYAQHGEDLIVLTLLRMLGISKPTYIDAGANHPYTGSNTALLYRNGGHGINIDANPYAIELMEKSRPDDINLCIGLAGKANQGFMKFYRYGELSGLNTLSKDDMKYIKDVYGIDEPQDTINVPVETIDKVSEKMGGVAGFFRFGYRGDGI